jgi:putative ABC transport system substrate-binding protein
MIPRINSVSLHFRKVSKSRAGSRDEISRASIAGTPGTLTGEIGGKGACRPEAGRHSGRRLIWSGGAAAGDAFYPLVFVAVTDPVGLGLVESLARPGGNATGFTFFEFSVGTKLLEALQQIAPRVRRMALMYTPNSPVYSQYLGPIDAIGPAMAMTLIRTPVRDVSEIEAAIEAVGREPDGGLMVLPEPFFPVHRKLIVELAARHNLPTIYPFRSFTDAGGLMSYSIDVPDLYRRAAGYVDRILKGERAADMPVQQPTKYQLLINLKTAKTLGLEVSPSLLARADEVIE